MRLHEHNPCEKTEKQRVRIEQRQQRLGRSVHKVLVKTAPASIVGRVIGHNVIPTTLVLQTRTSQGSDLAGDPKFATPSFYRDYILPVEQPQKRERRASSVGATQLSVALVQTTPRKAKPRRHEKSVAPALSEMGLPDDAQSDAQRVGYTAEAPFENRVSMDWVCGVRRPTKVFILCVSNKH